MRKKFVKKNKFNISEIKENFSIFPSVFIIFLHKTVKDRVFTFFFSTRAVELWWCKKARENILFATYRR